MLYNVNNLSNTIGKKYSNKKSFLNSFYNKNIKDKVFIKLKNGLYFEKKPGVKIDNVLLANKIYSPSYVSLETVLSNYSIIPEVISITTSVTTNKTKVFENKLGFFGYSNLKKELFFGYYIIENKLIAHKEKALLDFLYLNSKLFFGKQREFNILKKNKNLVSFIDLGNIKKDILQFQSLRLSCLEDLNLKLLISFLKKFNSKKLEYIILLLLKYKDCELYDDYI